MEKILKFGDKSRWVVLELPMIKVEETVVIMKRIWLRKNRFIYDNIFVAPEKCANGKN